ncbi:MAG: alcohol dehydrogenase catalytic domain-containing protein [Lachnospiraceae bacterium]|jgi:2-desacetyl-2-hydroxyethyl bacteriochlorophyllide A dehydrogenase|nr:alcohol dehydrogenase catalytic domain-containing protein [Lachnospiraceae bacterium]
MKSVNILAPQDLRVETAERPTLTEGQAIIRIKYCGICGGDPTAYSGKNPTCKYPIIGLGHEGAGYIEEIGENDKGLKVGDEVVLEPYIPCGQCHQCQQGRYNNCTDIRVTGVHSVGMMREYFSHPIALVHKIPSEISLERAVLAEPFTVGLHAATRAKVAKDDVCLIIGAGVIGTMAAYAVKHYGGKPLIVDVIGKKLDKVKEMGYEYICNSTKTDVVSWLAEVTDGHMADVIIETSGSPYVIKEMHQYCAHGARIALVGWPHTPVEVNTIRLMQKEVDIYGSRNSCDKFAEALKLIKEGFLPEDQLITAFVPMDEINETMQKMMEQPQDYLKVVVEIG